jgi:pimeloyl-ACP methyl ester carboxylesterase|nr:alpha/beta fold hydrolase [uncultured Sandarakinorhabdus sp.]
MAFDPDHGFVRISEGQIHYRRAGSADQRPLVMLHASPASSRSLLPLAAALPGRHLILPDTPGNGLSCAPAVASPNLATYAAMLDQAMDALGHRAIDLYGTHTGAHIAIEWAIAHPDRIGTLVLDGVALFSPELRAEFLAHYAPPQAIDASGRQFPWAWNMMRDQMIFWPHYKQDAAHLRSDGDFDPRLLHDLALDLLTNLETYHQAYEAVFRHVPLDRLPLVTTTTLWLQGEGSPIDSDASAAIAAMRAGVLMPVASLADRAAAIMQMLR